MDSFRCPVLIQLLSGFVFDQSERRNNALEWVTDF